MSKGRIIFNKFRGIVSFDKLTNEILIECYKGGFEFGVDVQWLTTKKIEPRQDRLLVPHNWPKLAAIELSKRGLGEFYRADDETSRFKINEFGKIEAIRIEEKLNEMPQKKDSLTASAWGAILTGIGVVVAILIAYFD